MPRKIRELIRDLEMAGFVDPFADANPHLAGRGRKARLRVTPEQSPAFMPGSRGAYRGGKGSHRNYVHGSGVIVTLSGKPGDDAKRYQERTVLEKIRESRG
jgi:predicted RNA binding protein YcfA (HicA-like mRNA interferase family)